MDDAGNLVIPAAALGHDRHGGTSVVLKAVPGSGAARGPRRGLVGIAGVTLLLIALIAVCAANGRHWTWTGFADSTSLWNWLRLLVQPIALAFLTVRLLTNAPLRVGRRVGLTVGGLLALLIAAGYGAHWAWTGFPGKQLWDWLSLMLFPVVVVVLPEWIRRGEPFGPRAGIAAALGLAAFAVLVVGGYVWGWTWTGFTGNTFRDWLDLMIAPFLLPVSLRVMHTVHVTRRAARSAPGADPLLVRVSLPR